MVCSSALNSSQRRSVPLIFAEKPKKSAGHPALQIASASMAQCRGDLRLAVGSPQHGGCFTRPSAQGPDRASRHHCGPMGVCGARWNSRLLHQGARLRAFTNKHHPRLSSTKWWRGWRELRSRRAHRGLSYARGPPPGYPIHRSPLSQPVQRQLELRYRCSAMDWHVVRVWQNGTSSCRSPPHPERQ